MANPALENQVLLNRMFADTMDPFNRYFAQQLNLASNDLQRRRMLEDEARQTLTASKVRSDEHKFQMDREAAVMNRYIAVSKEQTDRAESVEKMRLEAIKVAAKAAQDKLDSREADKQTKFDIDQEGWNESFRQRSKERSDLKAEITRLETLTPAEHNRAVRKVARNYVSEDVLNNFFPPDARGDLEPLLAKYITDKKARFNAIEELDREVMMQKAIRQPKIDALNQELGHMDSRLRVLDAKISPAAHFPKPFPPMPPGFPGTPGAAVGAPEGGPTADMTEEERMRGYRAELAGGGGGNPFGPPAPPAPASPQMTGLIPTAARQVWPGIAGAYNVGRDISREVTAPAFAAAGAAYDVLMSGRPPLSTEAYGGQPPISQPYLPRPSFNTTAQPQPTFGVGAPPPDLNALGLAKPDLMGMRDLYLGDRLRAGITQHQADSELQSIVSKLNTGDGEARKIFQEYHKRWLQKKAMRGVVPQGFTGPPAPDATPSFIPRTTSEASDRYRQYRTPGADTNSLPLPQWGTGWQ